MDNTHLPLADGDGRRRALEHGRDSV